MTEKTPEAGRPAAAGERTQGPCGAGAAPASCAALRCIIGSSVETTVIMPCLEGLSGMKCTCSSSPGEVLTGGGQPHPEALRSPGGHGMGSESSEQKPSSSGHSLFVQLVPKEMASSC